MIPPKEEIMNQIRERLKSEFIPLFHEDGKPAGVGYSKKTKTVYKDIDALMDDHYRDDIKTEEEKTALSKIRRAERAESEAKKEKDAFEKAKKIKFSEFKGDRFYFKDDYHSEIEDILGPFFDEFFKQYDQWPEYVWATKRVPYITKKEAYEVYSSDIEDQLDPDYEWEVNGVEQLQKALDEFVEDNKENVAYWPDYEVALLIEDEIEKYKKQITSQDQQLTPSREVE